MLAVTEQPCHVDTCARPGCSQEAGCHGRNRPTLARSITDIAQVAAMDETELRQALGDHEREIDELQGRIEVRDDPDWAPRAQRALRQLRLHLTWITRELGARKKALHLKAQDDARYAKVLAGERAFLAQRTAAAEKAERIKAANDENARQIAVFKEVAREVLGQEMYEHLWELAKQRSESCASN